MQDIKSKINLKNFAIFFINIIAILYFFDTIKINLNNKKDLRLLPEEDIRSKGPNEKWLDYDGYTSFKLTDLQNEIRHINDNIELQFCKNINDTLKSSCIYKKDSELIKLAGDINGEEKNKNKITVFNSENEAERSVTLYLASGEKCREPLSNTNYKIEILLKCNSTVIFDLENKNIEFDPYKNCNLNLIAKSKYACGIEDAYGWEVGNLIFIIIGVFMIIMGIFIGVLAYKQKNIGVYLVCILSCLSLYMTIVNIFRISRIIILIIFFILFLIPGIVLSRIIIIHDSTLKYYMLLIGGVCGYAFSLLFNDCFIIFISSSSQILIRYIIIAVFIIIGVILGRFFPKGTYIIGTSLIGAYLIMRAISIFLRNHIEFINEKKLYDLISTQNYEKIEELITISYIIYPLILIIFTPIFVYIQIRLNPKWKDITNYKDVEENIRNGSDLPTFLSAETPEEESS